MSIEPKTPSSERRRTTHARRWRSAVTPDEAFARTPGPAELRSSRPGRSERSDCPDRRDSRSKPNDLDCRPERRISREGRDQRSLRSATGVSGRRRTERRVFESLRGRPSSPYQAQISPCGGPNVPADAFRPQPTTERQKAGSHSHDCRAGYTTACPADPKGRPSGRTIERASVIRLHQRRLRADVGGVDQVVRVVAAIRACVPTPLVSLTVK
jgi:hypothetical protein